MRVQMFMQMFVSRQKNRRGKLKNAAETALNRENLRFFEIRCPPCEVVAHGVRWFSETGLYTPTMIASPVAEAMIRMLEISDRVNPAKQLSVIAREVRMAESDLRSLLVELEYAPNDAARVLVLQKRNQTMRWLTVLMHAMVEVLEACANGSTSPLTPVQPLDNVDI